jgi:hypothetical protein
MDAQLQEAISPCYSAFAMSARFAAEVFDDPDSWLCAIGRAGVDIRPHLGPLLSSQPAARENPRTISEWKLTTKGLVTRDAVRRRRRAVYEAAAADERH